MVNSTKSKVLVILSVLALSVVMVFGIIASTSSSAYANETKQCSNETIEIDYNPQVSISWDSINNRHVIHAESSNTQYAWYGQKFTCDTFIQAIRDADKNAPEDFWKDVEKGKPIKFVVDKYKYVGSMAITQAAIDAAVASWDFIHEAEARNNLKIAEIFVQKPFLVEPHLEEQNCFCNIANVKNIEVVNGNFCSNAFGYNMPDLEKIITDNGSQNYSESQVKDIANTGVKAGCKWDAITTNPFTCNYEYTYNGTDWHRERIYPELNTLS